MRRGEIWWADLPSPAGSGPGYRRPMLVVQSDDFNESPLSTVICAVITSNLRLSEAPGNVLIRASESGLPKESVVNVSQLVTLDKGLLIEQAGTTGKWVMEKVSQGIRLVLGLQNPAAEN